MNVVDSNNLDSSNSLISLQSSQKSLLEDNNHVKTIGQEIQILIAQYKRIKMKKMQEEERQITKSRIHKEQQVNKFYDELKKLNRPKDPLKSQQLKDLNEMNLYDILEQLKNFYRSSSSLSNQKDSNKKQFKRKKFSIVDAYCDSSIRKYVQKQILKIKISRFRKQTKQLHYYPVSDIRSSLSDELDSSENMKYEDIISNARQTIPKSQRKILQINEQKQLRFKGHYAEFLLSLQITNTNTFDFKQVEVVDLELKGDQKERGDNFCYYGTIVLLILFFPLICIFTDWWRKIVKPRMYIPYIVYRKLRFIQKLPKLRYLNLKVRDNNLDNYKINILTEILKNLKLNLFIFSNNTAPIGLNASQNDEYDSFEENKQMMENLSYAKYIFWN